MGLDTHDVGGIPKGFCRPTQSGYKSLLLPYSRAGMVLTVEPGVYFNDYTLDSALSNPDQAKFIDTGACALPRHRWRAPRG